MKVSISKSKNATIYYLSKSVRIGNKSTTKTIERIGSLEEIKEKCGDMDPLDWAKSYAAKRSREEKASRQDILVKYSSSTLVAKGVRRSANIGYLFLQDIYYDLGLDRICATLSEKHRFGYDLNGILSMLVYTRILYPGSKRSSLIRAMSLFEQPGCTIHQVYRALGVVAGGNDFIQSELYKNSASVVGRRTGVLYYDCTNYYFEIEQEDDFRRYGYSKQHQPNPLVQMGLFMDSDGMPLSFSVFPGNENEQPTMKPLEKKILSDFGISNFVVCTDAGLSSTDNRRFNDMGNRKFVTTQPIKKLKGFLRDFSLSDEGWRIQGEAGTYRISELDEESDRDKVFYKDRWINEDGLEQHLVVTFSLKYRSYQREVRNRQIERAMQLVKKPSQMNRKRKNDPKRFIVRRHMTPEGEVAEKATAYIDEELVADESAYDGFYAVCTNLEDNVGEIINVNKRRWEIEECFRILKHEFKAQPVFLSREDRITAHFTTCFISLIVYRILEKKLNNRYTCEEIVHTLRGMNMLVSPGYGYIPEYTRTDLTDDLHDLFGFRTDYQIISQRNMKKICTKTKK